MRNEKGSDALAKVDPRSFPQKQTKETKGFSAEAGMESRL
jgi:hypothetical protein